MHINLKLSNPSINLPQWNIDATSWKNLYDGLGHDLTLAPLEVKALYILGIIYNICESVGCLLGEKDFARQSRYIPAYGIFASAIELLGRCIKGEQTAHKSSLRDGFKWLHTPRFPGYEHTLETELIVYTHQKGYTIQELECLRNYAAHGQATAQYYNLDYEIIPNLHPLLMKGLISYWDHLASSESLCNNLAKANIIPLRGLPILQIQLRNKGSSDITSFIEEKFGKFENIFRI